MNNNTFLDKELKSLENTPTVEEVTPALKQAAAKLRNNPRYTADLLKARFVALIQEAMAEENISKSAFEERMQKSRQYIGRVLNETANFTIESMAEICSALNLKLEITINKDIEAQQEYSDRDRHSRVRMTG